MLICWLHVTTSSVMLFIFSTEWDTVEKNVKCGSEFVPSATHILYCLKNKPKSIFVLTTMYFHKVSGLIYSFMYGKEVVYTFFFSIIANTKCSSTAVLNLSHPQHMFQ